MMIKKIAGIAALLWLSLASAFAQSSPNLTFGQVPTPAQWNSYFTAKQDVLGFTPLNITGGVLLGRLITPAPSSTLSGFNLTPGTAPGSPANGDLWATATGLFAQINGVTQTVLLPNSSAPLVILATGQSNFVLTPSFAWTPASNVKLWNNVINTVSVGTAYVPLDSTTINIAWKEASDIAAANPTRQVCLIDIAFNNQTISHWLPSTSAPDVYANIDSNITAALAACGATKIDLMLWWQGEADAVIPTLTYPANWATMIARFWADTTTGSNWFPQETPVIVHGLESIYGSYISLLLGVVNADPDKRRFVYTSSLSGATYWDASNPGHMTGQGYFSAGAMAASAYLHGPGRNSLPSVTVDPTSNFTNFGPTAVIPSDPFTFTYNNQITAPASTGATRILYGPNGGNSVDINQSFGGAPISVQSRWNGTYSAPTKLLADDIISLYGARGYDSAGPVVGNKAAFICAANGIWTAPNHGTYCDIYVTPTGTDATAATVRFLNGSMLFFGTSSGIGTLTWPASIGSPTWTLPTNTGTFADTASTPLVLGAATGNLTCPTCVTSSGGGAITGTAPIAVSAAGVVSLNNTAVTPNPYGSATASPTFTVDAQGRLTAAANVTITPALGSLTGLGTGVAAALASNVGASGAPVIYGGIGNFTGLTAGTDGSTATIGPGGTGASNARVLLAGSSAAAQGAYVQFTKNGNAGANAWFFGHVSAIEGSGTSTDVEYLNQVTGARTIRLSQADDSVGFASTIDATASGVGAVNTLGGVSAAKSVSAGTAYRIGSKIAWNATAPTIGSGFCTTPSISSANGTAAFTITIGSACAASIGVLTMPAATTGWACNFRDVTNNAANAPSQTASTTTSVSVTNYVRTTGIAGNWTAADVIVADCAAY